MKRKENGLMHPNPISKRPILDRRDGIKGRVYLSPIPLKLLLGATGSIFFKD
jgi:hypothetical protein